MESNQGVRKILSQSDGYRPPGSSVSAGRSSFTSARNPLTASDMQDHGQDFCSIFCNLEIEEDDLQTSADRMCLDCVTSIGYQIGVLYWEKRARVGTLSEDADKATVTVNAELKSKLEAEANMYFRRNEILSNAVDRLRTKRPRADRDDSGAYVQRGTARPHSDQKAHCAFCNQSCSHIHASPQIGQRLPRLGVIAGEIGRTVWKRWLRIDGGNKEDM